MNIQKIIIFTNIDKDPGLSITLRVNEMILANGGVCKICPMVFSNTNMDNFADTRKDGIGEQMRNINYEVCDFEEELSGTDCVIAIGGDGTMLRAARAAAAFEIPVLGINAGGKGFMAELELSDIDPVNSVINGKYTTELRMMLDVEVSRENTVFHRNFALNDVVIKGDNKVIDLSIYGDDHQIMYIVGDGTVVATPTGSTAYSMAAGGPIVEPLVHNIIVTPICAHVLEAKSMVLASDRCVTVEIGYHKRNPAYMSVDGGEHVNIISGDKISITKSKMFTKFICVTDRSFYQKVNEKLNKKPVPD